MINETCDIEIEFYLEKLYKKIKYPTPKKTNKEPKCKCEETKTYMRHKYKQLMYID